MILNFLKPLFVKEVIMYIYILASYAVYKNIKPYIKTFVANCNTDNLSFHHLSNDSWHF